MKTGALQLGIFAVPPSGIKYFYIWYKIFLYMKTGALQLGIYMYVCMYVCIYVYIFIYIPCMYV